ncbi:MAG: class I SAM-dependent methyltransferase [Deltaproteobacteria bacterium]|nr:class I SAM-dependent methyltransferase [Deltaproteobacteria bacterium]
MNMAQKGSFRKWNEEMVNKYNPEDYIFHSNVLVRLVELKRFRKIVDFLSLNNMDDLLDIGCGSGYLLNQAICKRGVGVDISDLMVRTARANCKSNVRKFIVQADVESLPFKNRSFNKIVSTEVIEHILHPMALLKEIERVSKDNALIIITIPNERLINRIKSVIFSFGLYKFLFRKGYRPSRKMEDEWHLHTFNINKFKELIEGRFIIKKTIAIPTIFFPLRYIFHLGLKRVS